MSAATPEKSPAELRLTRKLERLKSGEMQCFQPGSPKAEAEARQNEAIKRCEMQLKQVQSAYKKETK